MLDRINSSDYRTAKKLLKGLLLNTSSVSTLDSSEIGYILGFDDTMIISEFLETYDFFTPEDMKMVEGFIIDNLYHDDGDFVSDLVDFANDHGLALPYETCISFIKDSSDERSYVVSSAITYVMENLKLAHFDDIYSSLCKVLNNSNYYQDCQVKAAFYLYRFTFKKEFLKILKDLVVNGQATNFELLKNILSLTYNEGKFFESDELHEIMNGPHLDVE